MGYKVKVVFVHYEMKKIFNCGIQSYKTINPNTIKNNKNEKFITRRYSRFYKFYRCARLYHLKNKK